MIIKPAVAPPSEELTKTKKTREPKETDAEVTEYEADDAEYVDQVTQIAETGVDASSSVTVDDFPQQENESGGQKAAVGSLISGLFAVLFF